MRRFVFCVATMLSCASAVAGQIGVCRSSTSQELSEQEFKSLSQSVKKLHIAKEGTDKVSTGYLTFSNGAIYFIASGKAVEVYRTNSSGERSIPVVSAEECNVANKSLYLIRLRFDEPATGSAVALAYSDFFLFDAAAKKALRNAGVNGIVYDSSINYLTINGSGNLLFVSDTFLLNPSESQSFADAKRFKVYRSVYPVNDNALGAVKVSKFINVNFDKDISNPDRIFTIMFFDKKFPGLI